MPHDPDVSQVTALPTALLRHDADSAPTHYDWLIDPSGQPEAELVTFRMETRIDELPAGTELEIERIEDHRRLYLEFEGDLADAGGAGTGRVTRMSSGKIVGWERTQQAWILQMRWESSPDRLQQVELRASDDRRCALSVVGWMNLATPSHAKETGMEGPKTPDPGTPKIQHKSARFGASEPEPVPVVDSPTIGGNLKKITAFGKEKRHEEEWDRTPNLDGSGAIHVKTFHAKLTEDALIYMDQCINEWLDAHPQYEVKFVNSTIGILTGKLKEPNLICQVWV